MTQNGIIEMARQAGIVDWTEDGDWVCVTCELLRFAKLVDAKATAKEREACAKEAEDSDHVVLGRGYHDQLGDADATVRNIAAAIRARGGEVLASPIIESYLEKDNLEEDLYDLAIKADNGGQP